MFRKGRKHFKRTLSRGRSDDELQLESQTPPTPAPSQGASASSVSSTPPTGATGRGGASEKTPEGAVGSPTKSVKENIQDWIQKQASGFLERWSGVADKNPALDVVKRLSEATQELDDISAASVEAIKVGRREGERREGGRREGRGRREEGREGKEGKSEEGGREEGREGRGRRERVRKGNAIKLSLSLQTLCDILMDPTANISAFEFIHVDLHTKLLKLVDH